MSGYNSNYYPDLYWPVGNEYFPESSVSIPISIPGCVTITDSNIHQVAIAIGRVQWVIAVDELIQSATASDGTGCA